ncbi:MAG: hypothetical protein J7498_10075 [Sphingobium sp.]|nr:hypothetical protein [Sphingobium sp.]
MSAEFSGEIWRRYSLATLALTMVAAPGFAASEPGVNVVTHRFNSWDFLPSGPVTDAILNGEKHVRKKAGKILVEGDCSEARKYALRKGRFDVASAVDRQCSPDGRSASEFTPASPPPVDWQP